MTVLEKIREGRRVAKMRMGQNAPEFVRLRSNPEIRLAIVPLVEREYQWALEAAATYEIPDNGYGIELRDRTLQVHTLFYALREPDNVEQRVFPDIDAMLDPETGLEPVDINYLLEYYQRMVDFSSPALDGLTDEQMEELKKVCVTIDWNALSGKPWWHLKMFFMTIPGGLPLDKSPSLTSILNSIGRSEGLESTPGASEN